MKTLLIGSLTGLLLAVGIDAEAQLVDGKFYGNDPEIKKLTITGIGTQSIVLRYLIVKRNTYETTTFKRNEYNTTLTEYKAKYGYEMLMVNEKEGTIVRYEAWSGRERRGEPKEKGYVFGMDKKVALTWGEDAFAKYYEQLMKEYAIKQAEREAEGQARTAEVRLPEAGMNDAKLEAECLQLMNDWRKVKGWEETFYKCIISSPEWKPIRHRQSGVPNNCSFFLINH